MKAENEELRERLSTHGLARHRRRARAESVLDEQAFGQRLRTFAELSGPVFVAFAHDLSTRLDLLPLSDCVSLSATEDRSPRTPFAMITGLVEASLGAAVGDLFAIFEQEPVRRAIFTQWHNAVTIDGDEVMVEVVRPEIARDLQSQLDQLRVLGSMQVPDEERLRLDMSRLVEDFCADLETRLDLVNQKNNLKTLSPAVVDTDALTVAEPVDHLCSRHVLSVKRIEGRFVDDLRAPAPRSNEADVDDSTASAEEPVSAPDDDIARLLCLAWMQQALFGECYPAHARSGDLIRCDDGRFAVVGGGISRMTTRSRNNILDYLAAAGRQDPDLAAVLLSREMSATDDDRREPLRLAFRQAEPFRDGGWVPDFAGQRLAHDLFVHWRLARRCGFDQSPHLLAFCRGLAELEQTTRELAPSRDALQQALDDVRVIAAAVNLRQLMGPTNLISNLERLLPAGQELLHRLNEISLDVNQGRIHVAESPSERHRVETSGGQLELVIALLMVMAAVALVTPLLTSLVSGATWFEPLGVLLFLALATSILWRIGKQGER